jgi:phage replication O-like protein O
VDDASPQLENGYTRLANELLDALLLVGLTARQWAVVMAVIRKTYGFNKKSDDIGLSQIAAMTGLDKSNISRTVRELEAMRVITREVGTHSHSLGVNKHVSQWGLPKQQPPLSIQQRLSIQQPGVVETRERQLQKTSAQAHCRARWWDGLRRSTLPTRRSVIALTPRRPLQS